MERLKQRYEMLQKALQSLKKILEKIAPLSPHDENYQAFRDSAIQRFKYSVDTYWKFMREYLDKKLGTTVIGSPKPVIKACADLQLIDKKNYPSFIAMIDDRNMTSHAYNEELAQEIFEAIPQYYDILQKQFDAINV